MNDVDSNSAARAVIENTKTRWSCRVFIDSPVPKGIVETMIDAANYAPSPMNTQPWEFIVLTGEPLAQFRTAIAAWLQTPQEKGKDEVNLLPDGDYYTSLPRHLATRKKEHLERTAERVKEMGMSLKEVYNLTFFCSGLSCVAFVLCHCNSPCCLQLKSPAVRTYD